MKRVETDLAARVVTWLQPGWQVYQEVATTAGGQVADIVAVAGRRAWVIECKTSFSLALIGQGYGWRGSANLVSVAVPAGGGRDQWFARQVCTTYGIGILAVGERTVTEALAPRWQRLKGKPRIFRYLREEQANGEYAPAGSQGGHATAFALTCRAMLGAVRLGGPLPLKALVSRTRHHYNTPASAVGALRHWLRRGAVPGLRLDETTRPAMVREIEEGRP